MDYRTALLLLLLLGGCISVGGNAEGMAEAEVPPLEDSSVMGKIHWLLDNHALFAYKLEVREGERKIVWEITGPKEALDILEVHIKEMGAMLDKGMVPRRMDPVFRMEGLVKKNISTTIKREPTKLVVVKEGKDGCSFAVIKAHAAVVEGFFNVGREEARRIHPLTEEIKEECGIGA